MNETVVRWRHSVQRLVRPQSFGVLGNLRQCIQRCLPVLSYFLIAHVAEAVHSGHKPISISAIIGNAGAMAPQAGNTILPDGYSLGISGAVKSGEKNSDMLIKVSDSVDPVSVSPGACKPAFSHILLY